MPDKISAGTLQMLERDLWSPSFDFASTAIEMLFEKLNWEIVNRSVAAYVLPYGQNFVLSTIAQVVNLGKYRYDPRDDGEFERDEEEPRARQFDNHIPKKASVRTSADYSSIINNPLKLSTVIMDD